MTQRRKRLLPIVGERGYIAVVEMAACPAPNRREPRSTGLIQSDGIDVYEVRQRQFRICSGGEQFRCRSPVRPPGRRCAPEIVEPELHVVMPRQPRPGVLVQVPQLRVSQPTVRYSSELLFNLLAGFANRQASGKRLIQVDPGHA